MNGVKTNEKHGLGPTKGLLSNRYLYTACIGAGTDNSIIYDDFLLFYRALDSNEVRQLYEFKPPMLTIDTAICTGQTIEIAGQSFDTTGCYQTILPYEHPRGCDSTIVLNLVVHPVPTSNITPQGSLTFCQGGSVTLAGPGGSGLSYQWKRDGTNVGTGQTYNATQSGTYTLEVTQNTTGCKATSTGVGVTVYPSPMVYAGTDMEVCTGQPVALTASSPGGGNYQWSNGVTQGQPFTPTQSQSYTVTVTDANGCTATDGVSVTVNLSPVADAGQDVTICLNQTATLQASGGGSYVWSAPSGNGNPIGVSPASTQSYLVTVYNSFNCTDTDEVTVFVNPLPVAAVQPDQPAYCEGENAVLTATGGILYLWTLPDGTQPAPTSQPLALNSLQLPDDEGIYTVVAEDANGCRDTATVSLPLLPAPELAITGEDTLCFGQNTVLTAITDGAAFAWNTGDATPSLYVYPASAGTYGYNVTVTGANGCTAFEQVTVKVHPRPNISVGGDMAICKGDTLTLEAGGTGANTYLWSNGSQQNSISVSPETTAAYWLIGTNQFQCRDTVLANVPVRYPPVADAGTDLLACTDNALLEGALPIGGLGEWLPLGSGFVEMPDSASTPVMDLVTGDNLFQFNVTTPPCPGEAFDTVAVYFANQLPILADDDTLTLESKPAKLFLFSNDSLGHLPGFDARLVQVDDSGNWLLSPTGRLDFDPEYQFTGTAKARYEVCNKLCPDYCAEATVTIYVRRPEGDVGKTQLVTPNGDGANEDLVFDYLDEYPDNSITIFNRWGDVVFRAKPYMQDWVKNHSGGTLPTGTYYYILSLQGDLNSIWGNVLLMR